MGTELVGALNGKATKCLQEASFTFKMCPWVMEASVVDRVRFISSELKFLHENEIRVVTAGCTERIVCAVWRFKERQPRGFEADLHASIVCLTPRYKGEGTLCRCLQPRKS